MCDNFDPECGLDAAKAFAAAVAGLTGLTKLDLSHCSGFCGAGAVALADSLQGLSRLQYLDCSFCCAGTRGPAALCRSLRVLSHLQHLNLGNNNEGGDDCISTGPMIAAALGPALPSLTALTLLDLSYNELDKEVAAAMAPGLRRLSRLCHLNLERNFFENRGAALLGDSLKVS